MWFDPLTAWAVSLLTTGGAILKENLGKKVPAENWANKELIHKDRMSGLSEKQILRNIELGRYYIPKTISQAYPTPHREKDGRHRIIIENCELHKADIARYGSYQAQKWVEQGKYNLNSAELEVTHLQYELKLLQLITTGSSFNRDKEKAKMEKIKQILATKNWNCRKTEAAKQWQKAYDAENKYYETK